MLAGFYANAVLLRYQYPMMIVTKTKEIFMKRLKRNKKMLTEQGSSDQSKSNTMSRSIQLHTNTFLDSVQSSELSKKTAQLRYQLFPQFNDVTKEDKSFDSQVYDIHNPPVQENSQLQKRQPVHPQDSFVDKLFKLSKNISLTQMVDKQAVEINLSPAETDVNFLICDFDEVDHEKIISDYQKLRRKDKQLFQIHNQVQEFDRFKRKSQINTYPVDGFDQKLNHEKTLQNLKYRRISKQMQYSTMEKGLKSSDLYQAQNNDLNQRRPGYYQTRNPLFIRPSEERFEELQESYKTLERFRPDNFQKHNEQQIRHIYRNDEGFKNRQKRNSYQQNFMPRQKSSSNIFHQRIDTHEMERIEKKKSLRDYQQFSAPYPHQKQQSHYQNVRASLMIDHKSHFQTSPSNRYEEKHINEFIIDQRNQMNFNSPVHRGLDQKERKDYNQQFQHNFTKNKLEQRILHPSPISTQKFISTHKLNLAQKSPPNKQSLIEQLPLASYHQPSFEEKQQKKKRIRQKAAQLLCRVKSHQYLTTRFQRPYPQRH